jgi:hypothetical protein
MGYNFRRQVVIEPCIVDFACLEARLIIEADGGQHSDQVACDARRTVQLEGMGERAGPPHPDPLPGEREPGLMPPHPDPLPGEREPGLKPPHPVPLPGERESDCTANPQIFRKSQ